MGFLVRRITFLMGVGLVLMILALNSSARHREMSYGLIVIKYNFKTQYGFYQLDMQTLRAQTIFTGISDGYRTLEPSSNNEWIAFSGADEEEIYVTGRNIRPHYIGRGYFQAWGKDNRTIFYTEEYPNNRLIRTQWDIQEKQLLTEEGIGTFFVSPDGRWLIYDTYKMPYYYTLYRSHPDGKNRKMLVDKFGGSIMQVTNAWVYYSDDGIIYRVSLDGEYNQELVPDYLDGRFTLTENGRFAMLQVGTQFYIAGTDGSVIFDLTTQYQANEFTGFSPDSQWIIFKTNSGTYRCRMDGTQLQKISSERVFRLIWHPSEQWTFYASDAGLVRLNWTTLERKVISPWASLYNLVTISPDGKWLIVQDEQSPFLLYRMHPDGSHLLALSNEWMGATDAWLLTPEYPYHSLRWLALGILLIGGMPMVRGMGRGLRWVRRIIG